MTFRLVSVDLPGHGRSDAPPEPSRYRAGRVVGDLEAVLDRFELERAVVLGYSMGARLALAFALARPHRTAALVLEGGSPGIADARERAARRAADEVLAFFSDPRSAVPVKSTGIPSSLTMGEAAAELGH